MSNAKPMDPRRRAGHYIDAQPDSGWFTPAQSRRMSRKECRQANRWVPGWKPSGAKGRPTPRRADVIRAKRARLEVQ